MSLVISALFLGLSSGSLVASEGALQPAEAVVESNAPEASTPTHQESSLADFEAHVRHVAERTAAAEKARKEQERLEREAAAANQPQQLKFFKYRKDGAVADSDRQPAKTDYQVIVYNSCYAWNPSSTVDWGCTRL